MSNTRNESTPDGEAAISQPASLTPSRTSFSEGVMARANWEIGASQNAY